jgi:hypothetical protein
MGRLGWGAAKWPQYRMSLERETTRSQALADPAGATLAAAAANASSRIDAASRGAHHSRARALRLVSGQDDRPAPHHAARFQMRPVARRRNASRNRRLS